ncbi:MAG: GNAT family N-acetyltransferase [Oscillospiraceae bacterium]|nr:GNAT family N-acetyltransferase [Oscillospiraceae bacterium]
MYKYSFRVVTKAEEWEQIKFDWNALQTKSDYNNIFLTYEWLSTWWSFFGKGELSIVLIKNGNDIISILPLYVSRFGLIRILRFIGTGVSDYGCFIIDKSYDAVEILNQAFDFICSNLLWDIYDMQQIPEVTSLYQYLNKNIGIFTNSNIFDVKFYKIGKCYYISKNNQSFVHEYNTKFFSKIQRRANKLKRLGNVTHYESQKFEQALMQRFFDMHIRKWQKSGKVSDFAFKKYREFHSEIAQKFSRNSWMSFSAIKSDDDYIAFTYAYKYNDKIYWYTKTYDPDFAKYSPGHLAALYDLNFIKNSEFTEVDLLRGEEDYKLHWTKQFRLNYRFVLFKKSVKCIVYRFYIIIMDRLYHTKRFYRLTRYLYKVLRQCRLFFRK